VRNGVHSFRQGTKHIATLVNRVASDKNRLIGPTEKFTNDNPRVARRKASGLGTGSYEFYRAINGARRLQCIGEQIEEKR
jgi:hypothetical protein